MQLPAIVGGGVTFISGLGAIAYGVASLAGLLPKWLPPAHDPVEVITIGGGMIGLGRKLEVIKRLGLLR